MNESLVFISVLLVLIHKYIVYKRQLWANTEDERIAMTFLELKIARWGDWRWQYSISKLKTYLQPTHCANTKIDIAF